MDAGDSVLLAVGLRGGSAVEVAEAGAERL